MATVLAEKQVLFSGIWRPSPRTTQDALLRQISVQFLTKKSLKATYQLCTDGLKLHVVHDNGRQVPKSEKIPLSSIQDICCNRYNPVCLMTIYVDNERRSNYLVCRCDSERDASQIVLTFREHKKSVVGEGYRIELPKPQGRNWTLMPKHENGVNGMNGHSEMSSDSGDYQDGGVQRLSNGVQSGGTIHHVKVEMATETFEREPCEIDGKSGFSVAVQTNFGEADSDRDSMMSSLSYRSLKDELLSLSQEIREIKFLLETTTGVSSTQYFKRDVNDNTVPSRALIPVPIDEQELPSPTDSHRHVNFAESSRDMPDHDIRSFGVQTVKGVPGRKAYYTKRQGRSEGRVLQSRSGARIRSSSTNSMLRSPASIGRAGGDVFDYPSTHGRQVYIRGVDQTVKLHPSSTIERPIEQVYHSYSKGFRNQRGKVIVLPGGHATMPALRRSQGGSKSSISDLSNH